MLPSLTKLEFDLYPKPFTITFVNFAVSDLTSVRQLLYHCYLYRGGSKSRDWRGAYGERGARAYNGCAPSGVQGHSPQTPHYRLALRARHMPPSKLYSWIRPWRAIIDYTIYVVQTMSKQWQISINMNIYLPIILIHSDSICLEF